MLDVRRGAMTLVLAGALLAGCGGDDDDNGGGGNGTQFTDQERIALATALSNVGVGGDAAVASFLAGGLESYGTFTVPAALRAPTRLASLAAGDYDAVGVQYVIDVTINGEPISGAAAYVVAWKGLDVQAQTVDEVVEFGSFLDGASSFPDPVSGTVPEDASAFYWNGGTSFVGTSGAVSLTGAGFGGSTVDCSQTIPDFGSIDCSYRYGSMEGDFEFALQELGGEGLDDFPLTTYDVPAVRVSLSGSLSLPAVRAEALKASLRASLRR